MVVVDCPWCEGAAEARGESVECRECGVIVEIAADEPSLVLAAA
jgi:hypothetical protein